MVEQPFFLPMSVLGVRAVVIIVGRHWFVFTVGARTRTYLGIEVVTTCAHSSREVVKLRFVNADDENRSA